jgi:sodium-coupled neutral amino acid transporter 11
LANLPELKTANSMTFGKFSALEALGLISYSFICHHDALEISKTDEFCLPSLFYFSKLVKRSMFICTIVSLILSLPTYWTFGDQVNANIFNNYGNSLSLDTARLAVVISMISMFLLDCVECREILLKNDNNGDEFHITTTIFLITFPVCVALGYRNLEMVLEVTGGLAASALAFIFPSVCYLKLSAAYDYDDGEVEVDLRKKCKIMIFIGLLLFIINTVNIIISIY